MDKKEKQKIVQDMMKDLVLLTQSLPDKTIKRDMYSLVYSMVQGHITLVTLLTVIDTHITDETLVKNTDITAMNSSATIKVWETARDIIVEAYSIINVDSEK